MDYYEYQLQQHQKTRQYEAEQAAKAEENNRRYREARDRQEVECVEAMDARELVFFVYGEPNLNDDSGLAASRAAVIDALTPFDRWRYPPSDSAQRAGATAHGAQVTLARESLTNRLCHAGGLSVPQEHALRLLWQLFETFVKGAWDGQYPSVQQEEGTWTTPAIAQ